MRPSVRWLVPVAVAATIVGGSAVSSAVAGSTPVLPHRSAAQVLAALAGSRVTALSGTVRTNADLGLPAIPSFGGSEPAGGSSATSPQALLTRFLGGQNTLRVWADGPQRQRVQLLDPFEEIDVIHSGTDVWTYSSSQDAVTHTTVPTGAAGGATGPRSLTPQALTPQALADQVLASVDPTTAVTLGTPATVAGRATYTLLVTPRTSATLVDHVVLSVDAANGAPLQVQVYARGHANAVFDSGFTTVSFSTPAAATFRFTAPRGASVTPVQPPLGARAGSAAGTTGTKPRTATPRVIGTGWTAVVELPAGTLSSGQASAPGTLGALDQITTAVNGGRALHTALFSVLITTDGRVLAGAVPVQTLLAATAH